MLAALWVVVLDLLMLKYAKVLLCAGVGCFWVETTGIERVYIHSARPLRVDSVVEQERSDRREQYAQHRSPRSASHDDAAIHDLAFPRFLV
jgi:hypothetical protein